MTRLSRAQWGVILIGGGLGLLGGGWLWSRIPTLEGGSAWNPWWWRALLLGWMLLVLGVVFLWPQQKGYKPAADVKEYVEQEIHRKDGSTKLWSFAYHGSLILAAVLSVFAGFALQAGVFECEDRAKQVATGATLLSGLLTTLIGLLRFQEKWQTSRLTKSRLEVEKLEFMRAKPDTEKILEELQRIRRDHDLGIIGTAPKPNKEPPAQ